MQVVICYDVSDDKRRTRLARAVGQYLDRVQKSTFEGDISAARLAQLRQASETLIDHATDSVRVYFLCGACSPRTEVMGIGQYVDQVEEDLIL